MGKLATHGECESYCSHGGVCERDLGHEGLHDSRYCKWTDAQAITYEAAQNLLASKGDRGVLLALEWDMEIGRPG